MILLVWALLAGAAAAEDPVCDGALRPPGEDLSVAWISPLGRKVGRRGWLEVVRTADLRRLVQEEADGSLARALQVLGLRRKEREPSRRWKVTIFDVRGVDLCRPLAGYDDPAAVEGAVTCPTRLGRATRASDGCGFTVDRASGARGLETYRIRWEDAARNGFCVLPAERFVAGSPR